MLKYDKSKIIKKGTLSYSINGEYLGRAFHSQSLRNPPIYAAVALVNTLSFKLETKKTLPMAFRIDNI